MSYLSAAFRKTAQGFAAIETVEDLAHQVACLRMPKLYRIVTSWITGVQVSIDVTDLDFTNFLFRVGEYFDFENPRVYALQKELKLSDRVKLDETLYGECIARTGRFKEKTKLYVCDE